MTLSRDDVRHVALLARLGLGEGDEAYYTDQLDSILGHIDRLSEVDVDSVPATAQVVALEHRLRADEARPGMGQERALSNAPASREGFFVVPAILEEEP
ncbi:MAG TPA: Asp-tRNA(Asn)/Glu-tRNA(Gln) amidotransferase subunit GatC [Candidatus Acidoferrales bacterium]|nr:Asp-tRNA(Asn)/Glu-tRNA(Gln) amidotransferase subunit GatC [Candidatus Acidoferrales bacterium]